MKHWFLSAKRWSLAILSVVSLGVGAFALWSCGGEGGPVGTPGGGGGGTNAAFLALLPSGQKGATYVGPEKCATCHNNAGAIKSKSKKGHAITASLTVKPFAGGTYDEWHNTLHASKGVSCENCHGPGSIHAAAPATTNILTFPNLTSPAVCAQCHGPIADDWSSSLHAQLIPDPIQFTVASPGFVGPTRCVACHSGLVRVAVENGTDLGSISPTDITTLCNQTTNNVPYVASCVTCHDPHAKTGNLTVEGGEAQLRHPLSSTDTSQIVGGTTAATYTNFNHQCAECHNGRGVNASDAALTASTARPAMHLSNQYNMLVGEGGVEGSGSATKQTAHVNAVGQCAHCHMPGASHAFKTNYDTSCQPCHSTNDAAARAAALKTEISNSLYALETRLGNWASAKLGNSILWEYTTNIPAGITPPDQSKVPIEIKRARHNYYFLVRDGSMGVHNSAYSRLLIQVANQNLDALGVAPAPAALKQIPTNVKLDVLLKAGRLSRNGKSRLD